MRSVANEAEDYILKSDVEGLDQLLVGKNVHNILSDALMVVIRDRRFDPSYAMIDYIIELSPGYVHNLLMSLAELMNLDKLIYISNKEHNFASALGSVASFRAVSTGQKFIDYNNMLLKLLDYVIVNNLISGLNGFFSYMFLFGNDDNTRYKLKDAVIYTAFRIMNDEILANTDTNSLEDFIDIALSINTNSVIIDSILKYLPEDSRYRSQNFRDNIPRFIKPNNYTSLLSENV